MISIQLYESYSRAAFSIQKLGVSPATYLESYVEDLALRHEKILIDFSHDESLHMKAQVVQVPLSKLVIGLANGWAHQEKTLFLEPADISQGYQRLQHKDATPRGFMFWTIDEEGTNGVFMARALNQFMHIR